MSLRLLVLSSLLAACSGEDSSSDPAAVDAGLPDAGVDRRFRAIFITDTHIAGPQYECCSESTEQDNASIVRSEERLREVVRRINAISPRPDLVFILGDAMHNPYYSTDRAWYDSGRNAFTDLRDVLAELEVPYHIAWGNHDYDIDCDTGAYVSREFSHELFMSFFQTEPYYAVDHKGWRFLIGNSQLGHTFEYGHPDCDTEYASMGAEQLAWLDEQLSAGLPSTFMTHYTFEFTRRDEEPDGPHKDLMSVLERHMDNVVLTLAGHMHIWFAFRSYAFPHHIIASTRYDTDNFWLVEFDPPNRSYRILDHDKAGNLSYCAETWTYEGDPAYLPDQPAEEGDCL